VIGFESGGKVEFRAVGEKGHDRARLWLSVLDKILPKNPTIKKETPCVTRPVALLLS